MTTMIQPGSAGERVLQAECGTAEQAARFLHYACRSSLRRSALPEAAPEDRFYTRVLQEAIDPDDLRARFFLH